MDEDQKFQAKVIKIVAGYLQSTAFTSRKLTDTPTDDLMVVPRKFVTANGSTRPPAPVSGQPFFDTTLAAGNGKPIWYNGSIWVDATGTAV